MSPLVVGLFTFLPSSFVDRNDDSKTPKTSPCAGESSVLHSPPLLMITQYILVDTGERSALFSHTAAYNRREKQTN